MNLISFVTVQGSPLNRADMRSVKINTCKMCVILTANDVDAADGTLVDKVMAAFIMYT